MWIAHLPDPSKLAPNGKAPSFAENILFTESINRDYEYPEHRTSFGIISVLSGKASFSVNGHNETIGNDKFLVINANSRLSIRIAESKTSPALLYFKANLPEVVAAGLTRSTEDLLDDPTSDHYNLDFTLLEKCHGMQASLHNKMLLLLELGGSSSSFATLKADIIVRTILEELIIQNKMANVEALNLMVAKKATGIELYKRLYAAKEWIDANYFQSAGLQEMAAVANMNSQHFLRLFKQLFHTTPHQYLISVRLENAKKMLVNSGESVQDICTNVGMESLSSFSWLFKKRFGMSPSAFRN